LEVLQQSFFLRHRTALRPLRCALGDLVTSLSLPILIVVRASSFRAPAVTRSLPCRRLRRRLRHRLRRRLRSGNCGISEQISRGGTNRLSLPSSTA
jgi:hypothetical protein